MKLTLHIFAVRRVEEFDGAFKGMSKMHVGGLLVLVDPLTLRYHESVVRLVDHYETAKVSTPFRVWTV